MGIVIKHYKGGIYNLIGTAKHSETQEEMTIYEDTKGNLWVRPSKMFGEQVEVDGEMKSRFEVLGSFYKN
ncbi:TPA: DUF1653 domain-containing protein [Salmonella enterica subsp. enterica serovar Typhi str. AG3]|nr:DUF1653 domain-containing protein [Salmonella enterica subsp. enterica serovar Typhi str. AG3]